MEPTSEERETKGRRLWLLPLLALLMSFFCVYSSTYMALSQWPTEITHAQMLAENNANYGRDESPTLFAPVNAQIIQEATKDSFGLSLTPSPAIIDASNPPALDTPVQIADLVETATRVLPPAIVTTATSTPQPTSEPNTPTPVPTAEPSATPIPTATATATATAVPTLPPANTATATTAPLPQPTSPPPPPPPPPPPTPTFTPLPTATAPPLPPPPATATNTPTATNTATATIPPTPTETPTATATPTSGPPPCSGNIPGGEPNIGLPNSIIAEIGCGQSLIVNLGAPNAITVNGGAEPAFDLVYYEFENPATNINLDWVIVEIGRSNTGPWVQVFYWGDDLLDSNTNIGQLGYGAGSEPDNQPIPFSDLYGGNSPGVAIDVDAFAPAGNYQWVRVTTPLGGANDAAEVDSIQSLP